MTQGGKKLTKADRKEEARRKRLEEVKRRKRKRRTRKVVYGFLILALIAGIVVFATSRGSKNRAEKRDFLKNAAAAGCDSKFIESPEQGRNHISAPQTYNYNTNPPTSGDHYGTTGPTGVHTAPLQKEIQVHNLEHGHAVISYKTDGLDQSIIDKLEDVAKEDDKRVLVTPNADMQYKVAVSVWGKLLGCNNPNDKVVEVVKTFAKLYKGKGPEGDIPGSPAG